MKRVMGCDTDGVWHHAPKTYPSTIDTACGRTQLKVIAFAVEGHPTILRGSSCDKCAEAMRPRALAEPRLGYPAGWPLCKCGEPVMDGKATCGRVECL